MEKDDKGSTMIRMGVSGWKSLLVPAYPGCPGSKAVKRSLLLGGNSTYTVQPPSKHVYKRHIPRMSTSPPKWFMSPEIVLFELYTGNKHPTQNTTSRGFWGGACKTNKQKVVISYGWMPRRTNSRPSLHTRSKSVQDKCLKGCNVLATEKQSTFLRRLREPTGRFPHISCECALLSHIYIPGFIQICSRLGKL